MIKNLTPNQLLLIVIATVLLILAAFSFYLLQDLSAPLPFVPPPGTPTSTPLPPALTIITVPTAVQPTRQTSYTPQAAFITPDSTPRQVPIISGTPEPGITTTSGSPPPTTPVQSTTTLASTPIPPSASTTSSPTATETLSPGEHGVTGRVVQNGTPVANVLVEFADDVSPRQTTTNSSGHYWFTTLAPGADFTLTFNQSDNRRLTPTAQVASLAWIEGTLPTGVDIIDLPDFEVSTNLNGMFFELLTPSNGSSFSASAISASNPIQFAWSLYSTGETYMIQLGTSGSNDSIWSYNQPSSTSYMWNGTLDDGTHIKQGSYWWEVSVTKSLANYVLVVFTQQFQIQFNP
jgi:Carboxypeptidase regulatory-like domain